MEFFFPDIEDPNQTRLHPEDVRFEDITIEPYEDHRRVHVGIKITPFLKRPYIEIVITNREGHQMATASIVEPMNWNLGLTMHLRPPSQEGVEGTFTFSARMFYPELESGDVDRREITFEIAPES